MRINGRRGWNYLSSDILFNLTKMLSPTHIEHVLILLMKVLVVGEVGKLIVLPIVMMALCHI
jgi:hypothetical protein